MKKRRLLQFTAVVSALLLLVSCGAQGVGSLSSAMTQNENHSATSSEAFEKETSSEPARSDEENITSQNTQANKPDLNRSPQQNETSSSKNDTTSSKPDNTVTSIKQEDKTTSEQTSPKIPTKEELMARKYVMLPDNPAPVKVNRPDAATPTPISYTNMIYNGNAISFESQSIRGHGKADASGKKRIDRYIAIVNTYDEYKTLFTGEYNRYNQDYFKDKAVIVLYIIDGTYDSKQQIVSVTQSKGQMCIHLKNVSDGGGYMMDYACILVEVSKSALKDIEDIVVYEEKIYYTTADGKSFYYPENIYRDKVIQA